MNEGRGYEIRQLVECTRFEQRTALFDIFRLLDASQ